MRYAFPLVVLAISAAMLFAFQWKRGLAADTSIPPLPTATGNLKQATFAAGCFWGVEEAFKHLKGVTATAVGYTAGHTKEPTYKQVCTGLTGHAEAVLVTFDPKVISYAELLDAFWSSHDPTTLNRQGPDFGSQYRSGIYFHDAEQEKIAKASLKEVSDAKIFPNKVVTEVVAATQFYMAETYHQQYFAKEGAGQGCHTGIATVKTTLAKDAVAARLAAEKK